MTVLTLYHGSERIVEKPMFGKGNPHTDYGQGFYCTESLELAKEWACRMGNSGYANRYALDTDGLTMLDLEQEEYNPMNWIAILLKHRTFDLASDRGETRRRRIIERFNVDTSGYDLVRGYRADDSYFLFASRFVDGLLSYEALTKALRLGNLGIQIVLKSEKAFDRTSFVDHVPASHDLWAGAFSEREETAMERFTHLDSSEMERTYVEDILEGRADP